MVCIVSHSNQTLCVQLVIHMNIETIALNQLVNYQPISLECSLVP